MKDNPTQLRVAVVIACGLVIFLLYQVLTTLMSPVVPNAMASQGGSKPVAVASKKVLDTVVDPFYHPQLMAGAAVMPGGFAPASPGQLSTNPALGQAYSPNPQRPPTPGPILGQIPNPPKGQGAYQPLPIPGQISPPPQGGMSGPGQTAAAEKPVVKLTLQGVIRGGQPTIFLSIDGAPALPFQVGDEPKTGLTILAITPKSATFEFEGQTFTLLTGQVKTL